MIRKYVYISQYYTYIYNSKNFHKGFNIHRWALEHLQNQFLQMFAIMLKCVHINIVLAVLIFMVYCPTMKRTKVGPLENFLLYCIMCVPMIMTDDIG